MTRGIGLLAAVLALAAPGGPAHALHEESEPAAQVTSGPPHFLPPGRAWGPEVTFASDQDLTGLGPAREPGRQIFVFNLVHYDCAQGLTKPATTCPNPLPPYLVQVTNGVGNPDNPSLGASDSLGNQWVVFDADGTYGGAPGPAAAHRQVFLKNLATSEIRMVPAASDGDSVRPTVNRLASLVTFESTATLAGFPASGVRQLFVYERGTNILRKLTFGSAPSTAPSLNGTTIGFESSADLLGNGADTGVRQIFWARYDLGTHTGTLTQLTAGNAPSRRPFVTENNEILFDSAATNIPGGLTSAGIKIFRTTRVDLGPPTLAQVTNPAQFGDCTHPASSPGDRLAFICSGDPLQNGTRGRRLFVLDQSAVTLYQVTGEGDVEGPLGGNVGEWFVTLSTNSPLAGGGACGHQIYVVDYNPGFWNAATQIGQLPPDAGTPPACSDGNFCNGQEVCGATPGSCLPGALPACDDLNPCTTESCHPLDGCQHTSNALACNDRSLCTSGDVCSNGACSGTPLPCGDGNACNGVETCHPATGVCAPGPAPVCNDGNPCTNDSCSPALGCVYGNNSLPCNDDDPCTTGDVCQAGTCSGTGPVCGNGVIECGENCDDGALNGTPGHPCTAACAEPPPALRIPGGRRATECASEWSIDTAAVPPPLPRLPATRQTCVDGDPGCDFDPAAGTCRFHVWQCLAGSDPRIACPAIGVASAVVTRPRLTETGPAAAARAALVDALGELGFPLPAGEACTRRIDVDVPIGYTRLTFSTEATPTGGARPDRDMLKLRCVAP